MIATSVPLAIVDFKPDDDTRAFIAAQRGARHSRRRFAARAMLRPFLGDFALNGLFNTYPLHLMSTSQWATLLGPAVAGRLLDVGAACGDVTRHLAPLFDHVTAVEVNRPMVRRLRAQGLDAHLLDITTTVVPGAPFDTVVALNVLDRCARPLSLLDALIGATRRGGHVVVSMPLPYDPCWYDGPRLELPIEKLTIDNASFESGCRSLAAILESKDLTITKLGRAPYLSGGDRRRALYTLDAAIVVARIP